MERRLRGIWIGNRKLRVYISNRSYKKDEEVELKKDTGEGENGKKHVSGNTLYADIVKRENQNSRSNINNQNQKAKANMNIAKHQGRNNWEAGESRVEYLQKCAI